MVLVIFWLTRFLAADPIGSGLADGVQLIYESGGAAQAPWLYDSVRVVSDDRFTRCVVATRSGQAPRESCMRGDTLFERRAGGAHVAVRPIGQNMELDVRTASGDVLRYVTRTADSRTVGSESVTFLPTTIVTRNSDGAVTRRLREDYAPSLLTALWGVFEEPQPDGGWRTTREFSLAEIVRPAAPGQARTRTRADRQP